MSTRMVAIPEAVLAWPFGDDAGQSSKCIWRTMLGMPEPDGWGDGAYPLDPSDFGRCYRLLALVPEWRARIDDMRVHGPVWERLCNAWAQIERAYEEELAVPDAKWAPRTYALIKECVDR